MIQERLMPNITGIAPKHLKGKVKERWERKRDADHTARNTGIGGCMKVGCIWIIVVLFIVIVIGALN